MLARNLTFPAQADLAGRVLGARVLASRADSVRKRVASWTTAILPADRRRHAAAATSA